MQAGKPHWRFTNPAASINLTSNTPSRRADRQIDRAFRTVALYHGHTRHISS